MRSRLETIQAENAAQKKMIDALPEIDGLITKRVRVPLVCPTGYSKCKNKYNFSNDDIKLGCELLNLRKKRAEPVELKTYIHPRFIHHANKGDKKRTAETHELMIEKYSTDADLYYDKNGEEQEVENYEIDLREFDQNDWDIAVYMCFVFDTLKKVRKAAHSRNTNIIMKEEM